jgi:hypothetical protein
MSDAPQKQLVSEIDSVSLVFPRGFRACASDLPRMAAEAHDCRR